MQEVVADPIAPEVPEAEKKSNKNTLEQKPGENNPLKMGKARFRRYLDTLSPEVQQVWKKQRVEYEKVMTQLRSPISFRHLREVSVKLNDVNTKLDSKIRDVGHVVNQLYRLLKKKGVVSDEEMDSLWKEERAAAVKKAEEAPEDVKSD